MAADPENVRISAILTDPRVQKMAREASFDRAAIDAEKRTVELSFASETPVDRWFGREILDMKPDSCDLSRLNNGGAVLVNHDWDRQVGVVEKAWMDPATNKARARVKFSRSVDGEEIFRDIQDGIRSLVSFGYVIRKMVLESVDGDVETHRATDWQPFEVSLVSVPADPSVGVGRSKDNTGAPSVFSISTSRNKMTPEELAAQAASTNARTEATASERARIKELNDSATHLATRHPQHADAFRALAVKCTESGDNIAAFHKCVVNDILKTEGAAPATRQGNALIGMSGKDVKRYSVLRAIRNVIDNKPLDGLERECSDEVAKKLDRAPMGFFLPDEIVADAYAKKRSERTLLAGNAPDGGYTVGSELLSSEFMELLRNNTKVVELGGRYISGLVGDVSIPRQLTGAAAYWVSETGSITQSSATFGQVVARPRRIGTSVPYSKQFLAQSSLGAEAFVVNDSDLATAVDLDRVALRGTGEIGRAHV